MRYLCLHGFTGTPESLGALELGASAVAPALGGHLHVPARGDFLDEVERLAALGASCSGLFGYSLGGRLALGLLARYPERFERALIVSAQPGLATEEERSARRLADQRFVTLLQERGLEAFIDAWQALPMWASQGQLTATARAEQRAQRLRHSAAGLAASLLQHGLGEMPDFREHLRGVRTHVELLVGERDAKFVALGRELAALLPNARLTIAQGAGHNLLLERPELCRQLLGNYTG